MESRTSHNLPELLTKLPHEDKHLLIQNLDLSIAEKETKAEPLLDQIAATLDNKSLGLFKNRLFDIAIEAESISDQKAKNIINFFINHDPIYLIMIKNQKTLLHFMAAEKKSPYLKYVMSILPDALDEISFLTFHNQTLFEMIVQNQDEETFIDFIAKINNETIRVAAFSVNDKTGFAKVASHQADKAFEKFLERMSPASIRQVILPTQEERNIYYPDESYIYNIIYHKNGLLDILSSKDKFNLFLQNMNFETLSHFFNFYYGDWVSNIISNESLPKANRDLFENIYKNEFLVLYSRINDGDHYNKFLKCVTKYLEHPEDCHLDWWIEKIQENLGSIEVYISRNKVDNIQDKHYFLLGKAYLYQQKLEKAFETFQMIKNPENLSTAENEFVAENLLGTESLILQRRGYLHLVQSAKEEKKSPPFLPEEKKSAALSLDDNESPQSALMGQRVSMSQLWAHTPVSLDEYKPLVESKEIDRNTIPKLQNKADSLGIKILLEGKEDSENENVVNLKMLLAEFEKNSDPSILQTLIQNTKKAVTSELRRLSPCCRGLMTFQLRGNVATHVEWLKDADKLLIQLEERYQEKPRAESFFAKNLKNLYYTKNLINFENVAYLFGFSDQIRLG